MSLVVLKQPGEKVQVAIDFTTKLGDEALTISSITSLAAPAYGVIAGSAAVSLSGQSISGQEVRVFVDGGTHGEDYTVRCVITDNIGQVHEGDGTVRVIEV